MFGFVVIEVMTLSGHPLIINKISVYGELPNFDWLDCKIIGMQL